ncbi:NAD(P)H-binding protein [Planotetraspora kaengkrachanensis]|uniref:Nucleotide-diphosphate-sugar epimerase n=1 Tax=Planotetraspora kaengkrachanensis TaxID=575193 RepID=A0A8J3VBI9_9ACTN|nr:NAD(P)H-binding protein [Planotetraspora kaengkrachanensis]GIG84057.1 nucleotide-diphosphate-sugar epimerase [Planotetraspora kaengkrachanensis]
MILVTGATGNVGRHVLDLLVEDGRAVRVLTRRPQNAVWPAEVDVVAGDLADAASLGTALAGADTVFLFAVPGSGPGFVAAARQAGVRRVVLLSSGAVSDDDEVQDGPIASYHAEIEQALRASGLEWTFLRPDVFAANTLMWAGQTKSGDVVRGAYAEAAAAPVHEADIAAVAAAALTQDGHAGRVYELTGPESLTHAEQARILGEVLGRPIRFAELPAETVRQAMSAHVPAPILDGIFKVWSESVGRAAPTTTDVEKVTGRPARSYREWVLDRATAF